MDITNYLKELGLSKFSVAWAYLTGGGMWGIAKLGCKAFTKMLQKTPITQWEHYAEITGKIAQCVKTCLTELAGDSKYLTAGLETVAMIETFAGHLKDGEYTQLELQQDIGNIKSGFAAWRAVYEGKGCKMIGLGEEK